MSGEDGEAHMSVAPAEAEAKAQRATSEHVQHHKDFVPSEGLTTAGDWR